MHIHIILYPATIGDIPLMSIVSDVMRQQNTPWSVNVAHHYGEGALLAQKALKDGADLIAVYGAPADVSDVAQGMIGNDTPLLVLPDTPTALRDALNTAAQNQGTPTPIDVGCIDHRHIFNTWAYIGQPLPPPFEYVDPRMQQSHGQLANLLASLRASSAIDSTIFELEIDGQRHFTAGIACLISNDGDFGAFNEKLGISKNDGGLHALIIKNAVCAAVSLEKLLINLDDFEMYVTHMQGAHIRCQTQQTLPIFIGDQHITNTPVELNASPQVLAHYTLPEPASQPADAIQQVNVGKI